MPARFRILVSAGLATVVALVGPAGPATAAPAAPAASPAQAAHPYSDPTWFPLRTPASIGCAKTGCGTSADHGYHAIDFLGRLGDPVHPAGAGVAHVGQLGRVQRHQQVESGRWVRVDHGCGVTRFYHHLDSITVSEGQLVTPATRIGTMGPSGDVAPCTTNYLHFEVRHGGLHGDRVDFGPLRGCGADGPLLLPQALGFDSWNDPGLHPRKRLASPALDSTCVSPDWSTTASAPAPAITRTPGTVKVSLVQPAATRWTVDLQVWRPTLKAWRTLSTTTVPASSTELLLRGGVEDDRRYRVRAAVHQGQGWSAWSNLSEVVAAPGAPGLRYLQWKRATSKTKSYLHYGWSRPDSFGSTTSRYEVARRCGADRGSLGSWKSTKLKGSTAYVNLRGLGRRRCARSGRVRRTPLGPGHGQHRARSGADPVSATTAVNGRSRGTSRLTT